MLTAVVFDVGETLVDESRLWRAWADWLGVSHAEFDAALAGVIERGEFHRRVFEVLRPGFDVARARAERGAAGNPDEFEARDLYPDVPECIAALARRGLTIGIAGNQPLRAGGMLRDLGLPVDFVGSSERWGVQKPSPEFFSRIATELDLEPHAIAYVGDRLDNDVLPALAVGMIAVHIARGPWGRAHARRPDASRADARIASLSELPAALERLKR